MRIVRYEVGWSESNVLGSGCDYHVAWEGESEELALEALHQPGMSYMARVVFDTGKYRKEWYNLLTKEWEYWYSGF